MIAQLTGLYLIARHRAGASPRAFWMLPGTCRDLLKRLARAAEERWPSRAATGDEQKLEGQHLSKIDAGVGAAARGT